MKLLGFKDFWKAVLMRIQQFALKCMAVKILPFLVASVALFFGKVDSLIWLGTALLFVSLRTFEKFFLKETPPTIQAGAK